MKNIFDLLLKEVFDSISDLKNLDGFDIVTEKTPNGTIITVKQKPLPKQDEELENYIKDFELYVKNTDNFIFDDAIEMFDEVSDITLNDLQTLISEKKDKELIIKYGNCFKDCIKAVVNDFISELQEKYEIG